MCWFNDRLHHSQYNGKSVRIFHTFRIRSLPATRCISRHTEQPHGVRGTCPHLTTPVPNIQCTSTRCSPWPITPYLTLFPKPPPCHLARPYSGTEIILSPHSYFVFNGVWCHRLAVRSLNFHHWSVMVCPNCDRVCSFTDANGLHTACSITGRSLEAALLRHYFQVLIACFVYQQTLQRQLQHYKYVASVIQKTPINMNSSKCWCFNWSVLNVSGIALEIYRAIIFSGYIFNDF